MDVHRIHQLDPLVVNQIAAGEVIERPASVVKELLDNSLDAGATQIAVDVTEGGRELIRVVDNGCGIQPDDLALAFASHATSKLRHPDDLQAIRTMGFRGEALASIGSVAQVTLQSRPRKAQMGAELRCDGGVIGQLRPWNGQSGTRVEARQLFYNIPARRSFLKSQATEIGHICEIVTRLALAYPAVGIRLMHNDKEVYDVPTSTLLPDRLRLFFGREVGDKLMPVDATTAQVRLSGFIADPAVDRGNARLQYLFVNGRWIRDRTLGHAIQDAFHGLLMTGRYAVAFLFLELPPNQVDVNVHPTKVEVRFRDGQALHHFVRSALRNVLNQHELVPRLRPSLASVFAPGPRPISAPSDLWSLRSASPSPGLLSTDAPSPVAAPATRRPMIEDPEAPAVRTIQQLVAVESLDPAPASVARAEAPLKAIQLHRAYLVIETDEGMLVVDQHALHERVLFEQFKNRLCVGPVESQQLLIPEPVDLPREEADLVVEHKPELLKLGLEVQEFGNGTVLVRSYPAALSRITPTEILRSVAQLLTQAPKALTTEQIQHDLLAMMACKAAVKAGDLLGPDEITSLLEHRHLVADAHHCPHGRPTSLYFSKHDLDKQFQRI